MKFEFSANTPEMISSDVILVFAFNTKTEKNDSYEPLTSFLSIDKILEGQLKRACDLEKFTGKRGEMLAIIPEKKILPSRIVVLGLGTKAEFIADDLRRSIGIFTKSKKDKIDSACLAIPRELTKLTNLSIISQMIGEGFILGSYEFSKYKKKKTRDREFSSVIISIERAEEKNTIQEALEVSDFYSKSTLLARDLVNEQPSVATPTFLANIANDIAKSNPKITCKIINKKELEKMGMGAFLSIAKAADEPPKFIHLEYVPDKNIKKKLAIVGKGITFDSGGINVKTGDHMAEMKSDMAGAAVVLAVFSVIAEVRPPFPVMGLIAATPNLISASSTVPGDIAKAYNGKTIEILNTDAEGRVTMADSLSYAIKQGATEIVDLATLTGSVMVALGNDIAGLFSNNRELTDRLKSAARDAGEKIWELPLEKEYKEQNKSEVADIANIPNNRYAGSITAALFLEEFVENKPWAHLDIAGTAFVSKSTDISSKGGTGFGVRTLLNFLKL